MAKKRSGPYHKCMIKQLKGTKYSKSKFKKAVKTCKKLKKKK